MLDIHLKGVTEVGRAEKSVDSNEQLPDVSGILLGKRADGYLCVHNLIPADELRSRCLGPAITGLSMAAQAQPVTDPTEVAKAMNLLQTRYPEYAASRYRNQRKLRFTVCFQR